LAQVFPRRQESGQSWQGPGSLLVNSRNRPRRLPDR
jgi:hypothetical protein